MIELQKLEMKQKAKLIEKIEGFSQLGVNWDSYGGAAISANAIRSAVAIVNAFFTWAHSAVPQAFPTSYGGVSLTWGDEDIYIDIDPKGFARVNTEGVPEEEYGT